MQLLMNNTITQRKPHPILRFFIILFLALPLTACMVGPNFKSPPAPRTKQYTPAPAPTKTVSAPESGSAGKAQKFLSGSDIPGQWWKLFRSPELNGLINAGIANSPNLDAAKAVLRQSRQALIAQIGTLFPTFSLGLSAERERFSGEEFGITTAPGTLPTPIASNIFNVFTAQVNVSYTLDVFGGLRRQIEAQKAQMDYEFFELQAAYLTLTSNIVTTAITAASLQAQIDATRELIQLQVDQLAIVKRQFDLGGASKADVLTQETQVAQTRATLPPLQQRLAQSHHAMSVLIGELPSTNRLPKIDLDKLHLPARLPVSLPSRLVGQRPDIRAAEALLHSASAQVGVATANMLPQITLTGSYGYLNNRPAHLFSPENNVWNIIAGLTQPIFSGGSLKAKRCQAIAALQQSAAQYKQTVLQAFQNVADTLRALEHDAKTLREQKRAETAAHDALLLTQKQYKLGGVSYLSLLTVQKQYQQARISRIQAQAARYTDTAALFQALGGGWWNNLRPPPATCSGYGHG